MFRPPSGRYGKVSRLAKSGLTVLQVIPELAAGGAERTTLEIVEALKATGGRAIVVSEGGRMEDELKALGGELVRLPVKSKSPLTIRRNANAIAELIRQENIDIVHARSRAPAWSALWAARRTNTPFVTTYHGSYGGKSAPKKLYNSVMARGDIVIANSDFIADHVRNTHKIDNDRLVTIHRGVDTEAFAPDRVDPQKVAALRHSLAGDADYLLLLPGRLTDWKGQMVLIDALEGVMKTRSVSLIAQLVGDAQGRDAYVSALKTRIHEAGLDEFVMISGHYSDMPTLLAASDLVLAPSTRPEAFGRIAIEAGAMGKPVIVSDHGGQRETVLPGQTGWLVEPGNAAALQSAIEGFLALSDETRQSMGAEARKYVLSRFTKSALQEATLNVYSRLLDREALTANG